MEKDRRKALNKLIEMQQEGGGGERAIDSHKNPVLSDGKSRT